jgi:hypothetical protein
MDAANAFIVELVNMITTFHANATKSLFRNHAMVTELTQTKIRNRYCAAPGDMQIPISVSVRYVKASESAKKLRRRQKSRQP